MHGPFRHLWVVGDDGVELLERLLSFLIATHLEIHEAQVINRLDTVRLHPDGLQIKLL